jgi:MarR family 2-MHQ and catechol resistance regulon transcriptional repressor
MPSVEPIEKSAPDRFHLRRIDHSCIIHVMNNTACGANSEALGTISHVGGSVIALLEAAKNVQGRLESALDSVGLSPAKFEALDSLVNAAKPLALSELAGRLQCVRSNVTQLVDRLESDGLVKRVDCADDRRAIRAIVTPLGAERHQAGAEVLEGIKADFEQRVPVSDREAFWRVLSVLRE